MARLIEMRVDEVIWKIQSRRRSNSNELPDFTKGEADLEPEEDIREIMFDYNMMDVRSNGCDLSRNVQMNTVCCVYTT